MKGMKYMEEAGARILRAGALVFTAHVLFKLAGLIQYAVMGHYMGPELIEPVYVTVFEGCIFTLFLIGEEVIGPAFLPVFMGERDGKSENAAWRFAGTVLSVQFLLLLVVSLGVMVFPGAVIRLLTAWGPTEQAGRYELARESLVCMAPALICLSLGSTTYMILNGYKRFFLAAFGDAVWKFTVVIAVIAGVGIFGIDYEALIFGLVLGSIAKLLTHVTGMLREIRFVRFRIDLKNPAVRAMFFLVLPLICGIIFAKVRDVFNHVWVLSRLEESGLMQANSFGRKLYSAVGWLIPYSLSIAMFPFFCEMADREDWTGLGDMISNSARMLLSVFIPASMVALVLAEPLTFLVFHGGELSSRVAGLTSVSTACYTLVLPAVAVEYLLMQAFFASKRMISVTITGIVFSALSMGISALGIVVLGLKGAEALAVVALGFVLSRTLKSLTLVVILKRKLRFFPAAETMVFLFRSFAVGLVAAIFSLLFVKGFESFISVSNAKVVLLLKISGGAAGASAGFALGTALFRLEEPMNMCRWGMRFLSSRKDA